ncbi:phenylalanine--tRNA ligase subunit beta [Thiomonas intermedia]|uniref:phenylalanine--tRNA ligase subunit beta n=1 Tax=Thiomonas intermedia TaxID=926 RepID=UPI0009A5355A|nr:phenylalanine--tRNA ligase subunit beta [Thiomonas intermedia]
MQFPESWLRHFCNPALTTEALAETLTMAGLEVEGVQTAAPAFSGVVVGRVRELQPHPNADKLRVCQVDVGQPELLQIVCGAPNVVVGMVAPCALIGAELPQEGQGVFRIGAAKMRGVDSQGMLCSARELGLSSDHGGLLALRDDLPAGTDLREALALDEAVFTIKLTPNLGHCLSVMGVAREVSAVTGAVLNQPDFKSIVPSLADRLPVRIEAPDLCGRFSGRVIRGVNARAETPQWMKTRLERSGQRSISALVDISNYVMLELGRPSHVFDLAKIRGALTVRWAREGEQLELLNGQTVTLHADMGVIAAENGVESLAGIMGGESTAVTLDTTDIYLEAAFWWPDAIRGRARRLNFSTDAAARFERGVDYATTVEHLDAITALILDICGGQAGPADDQITQLPQRVPVRMRVARCEKVIGIPIGAERMGEIFARLGLKAELEQHRDGPVWIVTPGSERFDLEIEEDLIEEVARIHGYQHIPTLAPVARLSPLPVPEGRRSLHSLRLKAAALGYQETLNFSFVDAQWEQDFAGQSEPIRLLNPIVSQMSVMRSTLIGSLVNVLAENLNHRAKRLRLFELGRVFIRDVTEPDGPLQVAGVRQPMRLAGLAYGSVVPVQWAEPERRVDFYDVKADVQALCEGVGVVHWQPVQHPALHPGRSAEAWVDGQSLGIVGELHPQWVQRYHLSFAPVVFELDASALQNQPLPTFEPINRVPAVQRDLAFQVSATITFAQMQEAVQTAIQSVPVCGIIREAHLFDVFNPPGESATRSMAFRLQLQDQQTLTDERVDAACHALVSAVAKATGAELRS